MRHSDVFLDRERVARSSRSHAPEQWRLLRLRIARAAKRPASKAVLLAVDILKSEAGKFAEQDEEVAATRLRAARLPRRNRGLRNLEALRKFGLGQPRINAHRPDVVADRIVRRIAHAHLPLPQQCYQTCIFPRLTRPCYPLNLIAPNPREGRQREKLAHARTRDIRANGTAMCGRYRFADIGIRPSGAPPWHAHLKRARSPRLRDGLCRPSPHRRRVRVPSRITARQQPAGAKPSHAPTQPSLVGAKLSHQSARAPRSQASKPTPRQARRPAPEPSNRRAHRNKFVTFYRGWHLRGGFQLRIRHPTRKIFTCAETDTIEPARIEESRCPRDARSRSRDARQAWARRERQRERILLKAARPARHAVFPSIAF